MFRAIKRLLITALLCAVVAGCAIWLFPARVPEVLRPAADVLRNWIDTAEKLIFPQPSPEGAAYAVIRAIDGDTLLVSAAGQEVSVRLIGVDAPESVHPEPDQNTPEGEFASQWMKAFISGKTVSLEYDEELFDRYGRTLAYVYVDGVLLEDHLLRAGMARTLTMEPNTRYQHHFEQIEKEAKNNGAGFWGTGFYER